MNKIALAFITLLLMSSPALADELKAPVLKATVSKDVVIDATPVAEAPKVVKDIPSWRWNVPVVQYRLNTANGVVKTYW